MNDGALATAQKNKLHPEKQQQDNKPTNKALLTSFSWMVHSRQ